MLEEQIFSLLPELLCIGSFLRGALAGSLSGKKWKYRTLRVQAFMKSASTSWYAAWREAWRGDMRSASMSTPVLTMREGEGLLWNMAESGAWSLELEMKVEECRIEDGELKSWRWSLN